MTVVSMEAFHERLICDEEMGVAIRPVGTDGGAISTIALGAIITLAGADTITPPPLSVALAVIV